MSRYVIGDVHGCSKALDALAEELSPGRDDLLIFLGDFIDRGPDSRGVIDRVIELSRRTRVVSLRGNHEIMLMGVVFGGLDPGWWKQSGGQSTLASYGGSLNRIPDSHLDFFRGLRSHHETDDEIFVHAGYVPDVAIEQTDDANRYWNHQTVWPGPHISGKRVYLGHTPQPSGEVLDLGHLACIDTYCFGGGWLTAMDLDSHQVVQASRHGHLRRVPLLVMLSWLKRNLGYPARRMAGRLTMSRRITVADEAVSEPGQPG